MNCIFSQTCPCTSCNYNVAALQWRTVWVILTPPPTADDGSSSKSLVEHSENLPRNPKCFGCEKAV